jgi:hypothetical protein
MGARRLAGKATIQLFDIDYKRQSNKKFSAREVSRDVCPRQTFAKIKLIIKFIQKASFRF